LTEGIEVLRQIGLRMTFTKRIMIKKGKGCMYVIDRQEVNKEGK
jgi:hypothetical protein